MCDFFLVGCEQTTDEAMIVVGVGVVVVVVIVVSAPLSAADFESF